MLLLAYEKRRGDKMTNTDQQPDRWLMDIDFDLLMDLRVDYAFKLLFTKGSPRLLILFPL